MRIVNTNFLKLQAQDTNYLKSVWETIDHFSCPYSYNFHMHTIASDGQLTPSRLVHQAIAIGLRGFAITDHHSVAGYQEAEKCFSSLRETQNKLDFPHLWTGVEITSELLEDVEVHILGYGFDPKHPSMTVYLQGEKPQGVYAHAKQVIDSIHLAGGLVVLAHPERYRRSSKKLIPIAADLGIDGVETYYAYDNPKIWQPSLKQTKIVQQLAERYGLYSTCGTDTHGCSLLHRVKAD